MGCRITLTPAAVRDLEQIRTYVVQENPAAARRLRASLIQEIKITATFPRIGRVVPETGRDSIRELVRSPYRIIYRINEKNKTIEILRFWHAARGQPLT